MGYKSCPLISSIIYMKSIACSIQRPRRTAWEIKWHPRILTFPGIEPLLFLWPLEPLIKPILLSTWWMKAKVKEERREQKQMFMGKRKPAFIGSICFLMSLVLSEFWVSLKETVLILGKKNTHKGQIFWAFFRKHFPINLFLGLTHQLRKGEASCFHSLFWLTQHPIKRHN